MQIDPGGKQKAITVSSASCRRKAKQLAGIDSEIGRCASQCAREEVWGMGDFFNPKLLWKVKKVIALKGCQ